MFCPGCGSQENRSNQYCRSCGTDLRIVRSAIERPDNITASASAARDEIGRAVAARIREMKSAKELAKVTEEVLPQIEKFLESPEERRMRRMRTGTIIASIGAGAAIAFSVFSRFTTDEEFILLAGLGVVTFFIGLSFILNGMFFTTTKKTIAGESNASPELPQPDLLQMPATDAVLPEAASLFSSVTEHTTQHLKEKEPVPRG